MIPAQAAKMMGCTASHVRSLIRKGVIKPKKVFDPHFTNRRTGEVGFFYEITPQQLKKLLKLPKRSTRGRKRVEA